MPGGDGTGPMGMGSMTGRAAGYCAGYNVPGYVNPIGGRGFGRGMGLGFRGGRGGGFRGAGFRGVGVPFGAPAVPVTPYAAPQMYGGAFGARPTREQEVDALKGQAEYLEDALDGVKERIAQLEASETRK